MHGILFSHLNQSLKPDITIVNGENAAPSSKGITRSIVQTFWELGLVTPLR